MADQQINLGELFEAVSRGESRPPSSHVGRAVDNGEDEPVPRDLALRANDNIQDDESEEHPDYELLDVQPGVGAHLRTTADAFATTATPRSSQSTQSGSFVVVTGESDIDNDILEDVRVTQSGSQSSGFDVAEYLANELNAVSLGPDTSDDERGASVSPPDPRADDSEAPEANQAAPSPAAPAVYEEPLADEEAASSAQPNPDMALPLTTVSPPSMQAEIARLENLLINLRRTVRGMADRSALGSSSSMLSSLADHLDTSTSAANGMSDASPIPTAEDPSTNSQDGGDIQMQENDLFEEKIVTNDHIYDNMFSHCTPMTLLRVARLSQRSYGAVHDFIRRAFKIDRILSRFFDDPLSFRCLQATTFTLISGSTALQFFDRTIYPESDLDLYVPMEFRAVVGSWLLNNGYEFMPNSNQDPNFYVAVVHPRLSQEQQQQQGPYSSMRGVIAVFSFEKHLNDAERTLRRVQCIIAIQSPMEPILNFHSTLVMNVISWDRAYCLFPRGTLEKHSGMITRPYGSNVDTAFDKYRNRGFHLFPRYDECYMAPSLFVLGKRWIGDGQSWVIPLDTTNITPPAAVTRKSTQLTKDPCYATTWRLEVKRRSRLAMEFDLLDSTHLKFKYVNGDREMLELAPYVLWLNQSQWVGTGPGTEGFIPFRNRRYFDEEFLESCQHHFSTLGSTE